MKDKRKFCRLIIRIQLLQYSDWSIAWLLSSSYHASCSKAIWCLQGILLYWWSDFGRLSRKSSWYSRWEAIGNVYVFISLCSLDVVYLCLVKIILILSTSFVLTLSYYTVSDNLKPSNVGLDQEAQLARQWKVSMNVTNGKKGRSGSHQYPPPITYLHLHECNKFSVSNLNLHRTSFIYWIFSLDGLTPWFQLSGLHICKFAKLDS